MSNFTESPYFAFLPDMELLEVIVSESIVKFVYLTKYSNSIRA